MTFTRMRDVVNLYLRTVPAYPWCGHSRRHLGKIEQFRPSYAMSPPQSPGKQSRIARNSTSTAIALPSLHLYDVLVLRIT